MTTFSISQDERFPVYTLRNDSMFGHRIPTPLPRTLERWQRIEQEYAELQKELSDLYRSSTAEEKPR